MNNLKFKSDLIHEVRNGFIDLRSLHSHFDERHVELQQETHKVFCLLALLTILIATSLLFLDMRLAKALDAIPTIQKNERPGEIHPDVPRFDSSRPATPDRDSFSVHYVL